MPRRSVACPPEAAKLKEIAALANDWGGCADDFVQDWTPDLLSWRFFHPMGPRHHSVLIETSDGIAGYAFVSVGARHGILLARVIDWRASGMTVIFSYCRKHRACHAL